MNTDTLADIVCRRAASDAHSVAYTFLADGAADARSITWQQLDQRARVLAACIREQGAAGHPILLALPSGLAFVEALFACWYAGSIIVPVSLPRHQRARHRLDAVVADAGARFAIGSAATRSLLQAAGGPAGMPLQWIDPEAVNASTPAGDQHSRQQPVALLQYTSGSTGTPRGVVITHQNLMQNSALIATAGGARQGETIAGWLPLFHDMGLIGMILQTAFSGLHCVFMAPERFLMRPWLWLQMMSDYGACYSAAPNFAYDVCVDKVGPEHQTNLNLSGWRLALNGSEPVRANTLERFAAAFAARGFRREAFFPVYGLAEATLFVTGPATGQGLRRRRADGTPLSESQGGGHVGCGVSHGDTQIAIVDPQTASRVPAGDIGEIWVVGGSVAEGYWKNPEASAATFGARLEGDVSAAQGAHSDLKWLRTGDLGFVADGELFITGRLRELIIIAGRNHFPIDIERAVEAADPAIGPSGAVAFSVDRNGTEQLIVAAEIRREYSRSALVKSPLPLDSEAVLRRIRAAVAADNEVTPHEIILLRPGAVPRTSSGKINHLMTRQAYLNLTLERLEDLPHASTAN